MASSKALPSARPVVSQPPPGLAGIIIFKLVLARAATGKAPAAPAADPLVEQLTELAKLKDAGILTDEEFAKKKAQLLGI